eukprot:m.14834 g.14834  ORF g.14834 m.14834 type:complete len:160 (-) comp4378_c0_seq1:851-1330(-)
MRAVISTRCDEKDTFSRVNSALSSLVSLDKFAANTFDSMSKTLENKRTTIVGDMQQEMKDAISTYDISQIEILLNNDPQVIRKNKSAILRMKKNLLAKYMVTIQTLSTALNDGENVNDKTYDADDLLAKLKDYNTKVRKNLDDTPPKSGTSGLSKRLYA